MPCTMIAIRLTMENNVFLILEVISHHDGKPISHHEKRELGHNS